MIDIVSVSPQDIPMRLLLEADPSENNINKYLNDSLCYLAKKSGEAVGVCVLTHVNDSTLELHNIAIHPSVQRRGIGTVLLRHVIEEAKKKRIQRIELSTGTFGYQLAFYQRNGFRVDAVIKNYFTDNYTEPIYELGIQLKDMLRLSLEL